MTAERVGGPIINPDVNPTPERPLAGKTAIVTGGSRDIGAAIVKSLAANGVNVVFLYKEDDESANSVLQETSEMDGTVWAVKADLTTDEGRKKLIDSSVELLGDNVDFLILSTSGRSRSINEEASVALIKKAKPRLRRGVKVVRMTSAIAHSGPWLEGMPSVPKIYHAPARAKWEEEQALRELMSDGLGIDAILIMIAPPSVPSRNLDKVNELTTRATNGERTAEDIHNEISEKLGLPKKLSPEVVGDKIAELLGNPEIKSGYTELFSGVLDVQTGLGKLYGIHQTYVNTLQILPDLNGQRHGIGRAIASFDQVTRSNVPIMVARISQDTNRDYTGAFTVSPEHAEGHFTPESGFSKILPGHMQIRAAVEAVGLIIQAETGVPGVRLAGFNRALFERPVRADGKTKLEIKLKRYPDGTYDVGLFRENDAMRVSLIEGMRVVPSDGTSNGQLLEDQVLEGTTQTAGAVEMSGLNANEMPFLLEIGKTEFVDGGIKTGEGVRYDAAVEKQAGKGQVEGSVAIHSEGRVIGTVTGIRAAFISKWLAKKILAY